MAFSRLYHRATTGEPRFATERDQARAELVRRGSAIVPDLASRLGTLSATERHAIKDLAVALGPDQVAQPFARVMQGDDERAARAAVWCIERIEATGVERELMQVARHASWRMRSGAVTALARGGGARSLPVLIAALEDPAPPVRQAAAHALGERAEAERGQAKRPVATDRKALPELVGALRDQDASVRFTAARALGRVGPAASPGLLAALGEVQGGAGDSRRTLAQVVAALGATGDSSLDPLLAQLAADAARHGDPVVEAQCQLARGRLAGPGKMPPASPVPAAGSPPEQAAAVLGTAVSGALGEIGATRP
jgi:HEAT repeat protein